MADRSRPLAPSGRAGSGSDIVLLSLCGDVMTGRGLDQALPHPGDPVLFERHVGSAADYLRLAEARNGPIRRPVPFAYPWGAALASWAKARPRWRIVNLETSVTAAEEAEPKGINYRMHPANAPCLAAAGIDCCTLANNHVLDWGPAGLAETLETLHRLGIRTAGAGRDRDQARAPAILEGANGRRVLVFAAGSVTSGIPGSWAAREEAPGISLIDGPDPGAAPLIARIQAEKRSGDVVVLSIHWGGNWGYAVTAEQRRLAHGMIDAGVDIVFGHSSHHPKAIERYRQKLIVYGCGDFLNDYEGISGYEQFRDDLVLMYLPELDTDSGELRRLSMYPFQIQRFRLTKPSRADVEWLGQTLDRECRRFGGGVALRHGALEFV
jgi:poly-gamma-glutamate capsule biosynthesis protein CapA/YwtB (metallophosphatase superfamily)